MANPPDSQTRLATILRALPAGELRALATRVGAGIDPNKRVDAPVQVARVLVGLPEVREPWRLPLASAQLLRRLSESGGCLVVASVPPALEPLAARGIVYARSSEKGKIELVLPAAFQVQLPPWEGEDPRSIRALMAQASNETLTAIATHYLGKPATAPLAIALEPAWELLNSPERIASEVAGLASVEKRLLEAIELEGGEVETEELLDLEREPLRIRGAMGPTPSRRGVGFALERRGMLMPVHPNRHVIPTEVSAVIGEARASKREGKRAQIRAFVLDSEHEPRRARFAIDPAPLAISLALAARETGAEVREGAGTPRSLVQRLAQRFGREPEAVALMIALSRALGLWDASALSKSVPPGSHPIAHLPSLLFATWRKGGAWDEARAEPEVLRLPVDSRDPSPVGVIREVVLDALTELGEGRWVPWEAMADYVRTDSRAPGVTRLLRKWAGRAGIEAPSPTDIARRITLESLPNLGLVDVGESDQDDDQENDLGPLVRLTPRGRAILAGKTSAADATASTFLDAHTLQVGTAAHMGAVLALYPFIEIGKVGDYLEILVSPSTLSRAVSLGLDSGLIRASIESIAPLPDGISRTLEQMSVVVGQVSFVSASAFLWCDNPDIREMLRTRRQTADLFLDPSPPGGLIVAPGKDVDTVARRCRALGIEVTCDGQVVRARSTVPPRKSERPGRRMSTHPPAPAAQSPVPKRRPTPIG
ncbi:MAG: hypothetical protein HY898_08640 [Deltaproteobacteria bacterium]|nr:hypothetical protein [Deltaproteobacteria bacterium]